LALFEGHIDFQKNNFKTAKNTLDVFKLYFAPQIALLSFLKEEKSCFHGSIVLAA